VNQTLKVRFSGNNISPDKVSASEFAGIVVAYEKALLAVADKKYPGRKGLSYISIVQVRHESLGIDVLPSSNDVIEAADEINIAITNNTIHKLPFDAVVNLSTFQHFVDKYNCSAYLNGIEGIASAEITPYTNLKINQSFFIKGETTIYGQVIRIGGSEPKVRVQTDDGKYFSVVTTAKNAKELSKHLYERIGVKGLARWKKENHELEEIKLKSFIFLSNVPLTERLKGLSNLVGSYWIDVDNPDDYIESLRDQ
jgi:hypothetical protein